MKKTHVFLIFFACLLIAAQQASALVITHVQADTLTPGKEGVLRVEVENTLDNDIEDISLSLDFTNLPLSSLGSSEDFIDEIEEDDEGTFMYTLRASSNAKPGDYNIPYVLTFKRTSASSVNSSLSKRGTIGIKITASPVIDYSASLENPILNEKSKLSLKIINKGLGEARFVKVYLIPEGFTLLSGKQIYIGAINPDDFETASFDVFLTTLSPNLNAFIEYEDIEGKKLSANATAHLQVYTTERAIELGIKKKSNTALYISSVILLILLLILWRTLARRRRMKRSMQYNI